MKRLLRIHRLISVLVVFLLLIANCIAVNRFRYQETKPEGDRGIGLSPNPTPGSQSQTVNAGTKPEIVLQAGITAPQIQVAFSPDGRLLASMSKDGNSIKLWEVSSGRVLRQLESSTPTLGSSLSRPFRFSPDGRTVMAIADGRLKRWEIDTGRELADTTLAGSKTLMNAILSEDGRVFAGSSTTDSAVRIWDTASGREFRPITFDREDRPAGNDTIALTSDGRLLAVFTETSKASRKGLEMSFEVNLWEVQSGRKTQTLKVSSGPVRFGASNRDFATLAFSRDGTWIALRDDSLMKIWDVSSGRELKSFSSPMLNATSAPEPNLIMFAGKFLFSPDRRLIAAVSEERKISLLDSAAATQIQTLVGHTSNVLGIAFSEDSKLLASSAVDDQIKLWDVSTGREVRTLSGAADAVSDVAFSSDGKTLSVAGREAVSTWELTTGDVRRAISLPADYARTKQTAMLERSCILSRDGRFVIAGSTTEPRAKVWDVATGRELPSVSLSENKELGNATFNGDGTLMAVIEKSNQRPLPHATQSSAQPTTPGTAQQPIPMPDMSKMMEQMRKDPKKMQEQMKKAQEAMKNGDLTAGMSVLESMGMAPPQPNKGKSSGSLRILDVATGRQLQSIPMPSGFVNDMMSGSIMSSSAVSFSPDGRMVASALGFNAPIVLRDTSSGQELRSLKTKLTLSVYGLAWSPDGKMLASTHWGTRRNIADPNSSQDFSFEDLTFTIKTWDAQSGAELKSLEGHTNFVNALAFSRDGRLLASGSYDSTIKIWDLPSGRELRTIRGHSGPVTSIDFTPNGRFVVSGSEDGSARLWNTQTGTLLATMVSLNKGDDWLVVTPDGLFDGSPGGWNQILWRFSPNTFDVSPVEIFFSEYFHPGLLPDILAGKKIAAAVDISQKDRRQPKLIIATDAPQDTAVSSRTVKVKINVTEAPAGAEDVRLFRNGSLVKVWRGDVLKGQQGATLEATITVVAGPNQLTAYAFNKDNVKSTDSTLKIVGVDSLKRAATLHLLVVGVNQYANEGYNLKYAGADARDFAEELERQQRKLGTFGQIEITSLFDKDATKSNILQALRRFAGLPAGLPADAPPALQKIKPVEPEDGVIVFFAGHGTAQDQRFYLIPHDLGYTGSRTELDETALKTILAHSVSDLELEQACEGIDAGHLLTVIDACNSGQALEAEEKRRGPMNSKGLAQLAYEKGMYILTAAQSYQAAMEAEQLGHGYLTYALIEEGLKTAAADDQPKDGIVVLREWLDYATNRVPRMQEAKMKEGRGLKHQVAFVEGEEKVEEADKRSVQRPRVFYRREPESQPMVVAKP